MTGIKTGFAIAKDTFSEFVDDDCSSLAAALAYYTVFSLPPLLVLIIALAGALWGQEAVEGEIARQIGSLIGPEAALQVQTMIRNASTSLSQASGKLASLLGIVALLFGATGAFAQLQAALNRAWEVAPDPEAGGVKSFIFKRLLSFGMIMGIAFLLLVSLVVSAVIAVVVSKFEGYLPAGISGPVLWVVNVALTFTIISLLFGSLFKILPDAEISWRDVLPGAVFTALLFTVGKFLLSFYLGRSDPGSAFGAAGSLAIILVWIYYSSMILLLGAEFTQVWAQHRGKDILPSKGAVRIVKQTRTLRPGKPGPPPGSPAPEPARRV